MPPASVLWKCWTEESDITSPADAVTAVPDGSVDFNHVSFSYSKREDKCCLEDVDLHIPAGMTVGILGGTGQCQEFAGAADSPSV